MGNDFPIFPIATTYIFVCISENMEDISHIIYFQFTLIKPLTGQLCFVFIAPGCTDQCFMLSKVTLDDHGNYL